MKVIIPSQLLSYTRAAPQVQVEGGTLAEVLAALDRQFPGIRFRIIDEQDEIRPHMRIFVNQEIARDLRFELQAEDEIRIIGAISGG
jgi:molybdopterin converting factor small subunit